MSVGYVPIGWNRAKLATDAVLLAAIATWVLLYVYAVPALRPEGAQLDGELLVIRAWGSCAFVLLTLVLCIGPLARLDRRFLPLLYNRRHFGVITFLVALAHAAAVLDWYLGHGVTGPYTAAILSDPWGGPALPFVPFGIAALLFLAVLAVTSHDFWLAFLGPPLWKALHFSAYAAYAAMVVHISAGAIQGAAGPLLPAMVLASVLLVGGLHLAAARPAAQVTAGPWVDAGPAEAIAEGTAIAVRPSGLPPIAIFRHQGRLSAVQGLCPHQNGPLSEGRIVDGCITCPWHGFQYRPEDGCAPPPFTEKLSTYRLRLADGRVQVDPTPLPPGTRVEPLAVPA
jgi:nitrite reductase/ring-hydroxylating ferredoxin subunit/DMSO/TMAO reductase YedYZ heme-binding membrane subunit